MRLGLWSFGIALVMGACSLPGCSKDEDEPEGGSFGDGCDPAETDSCGEGLTCSTSADGDSTCAFDVGATCDPERDNGGCATDLACVEVAEGETACVVASGNPCDPELDNGGCAPTDECVVPEPLMLMPAAETGADGATGAGGAGASSDADPLCLTRKGEECDPADEYCTNGLVCAEMAAGGNRCFQPVVLRGTVTDTTDANPIESAHVIAIDHEGVAVSDVAVTGGDGAYALPVPVARNDDGSPVDATFTLRSSAQDYQPFPSGIRVALPIHTTEASSETVGYVVDNALTDVGLIPLEPGERYLVTGSIAGLTGASEIGGVLVLAMGDGGAYSAITDQSGNYTIFNVPDGSYELRGYAEGLEIESGSVTVAGGEVVDTELVELDAATTTVSGTIQIVNAPGGLATSVILVVEETFDPVAVRGEVPRGLRDPRSGEPDVQGNFTIEGVPDGRYVVLAAWENDDLVRDPDQNIAGTDFVTIEVSSDTTTTLDIADSFKVTEALEILGPGVDAPEAVDGPPTLSWVDDSSEEWYEVRVFDAFGDLVWEDLQVPGVSGGDVTVEYGGPLEPGMYYQFRATSWRQPGGGTASAISATEDLRGVFYLPATETAP